MSTYHSWQLVKHAPKNLTLAQGAIADAIARRILVGASSVRISQRALFEETIGARSKRTVERGLEDLKRLGIIEVTRPSRRKPSEIRWLLTCPEGCQFDHSQGNKRIPTRPISDGTEYPTREGTLRDVKREIKQQPGNNPLKLIEETLKELEQSGQQSQAHQAIGEELSIEEGRARIRQRLDLLLAAAESNPRAYLRKIITHSPEKLLPQKTSKEREQRSRAESRELLELRDRLRKYPQEELSAWQPEIEKLAAAGISL